MGYPSSAPSSLLSAEQPPAEKCLHSRVHLGRHGVPHTLLQFDLQAIRTAALRVCTCCCSKWLFQACNLRQGMSPQVSRSAVYRPPWLSMRVFTKYEVKHNRMAFLGCVCIGGILKNA